MLFKKNTRSNPTLKAYEEGERLKKIRCKMLQIAVEEGLTYNELTKIAELMQLEAYNLMTRETSISVFLNTKGTEATNEI